MLLEARADEYPIGGTGGSFSVVASLVPVRFCSTLPADSTPNVLNQKGGKARAFAPSARLISVLFGQFFGESGTPGPSREAPGTA